MNLREKGEFAKWLVNRTDPEYEYNRKQEELDNYDFRREKIKGDLSDRYQDWKRFEKTKVYANVNRARELLSEIPTSSDVLAHVLKDKYQLSNQEIHQTLVHLSRHREIETHTNSYSGTTTFKRVQNDNHNK